MPSKSRYTLYESHISGTFLRLTASLIEEAVVVFEFNCGRSLNVVLTMGFQFSVDIVDVPLV